MQENLNLKLEFFSDIGTGNPFVARIGLGLIDILNSTNFRERKKINDAIFEILFEGLMPAFISLRELRKFETQGAKGGRVPIITINKSYYNLYNNLWVAYKDGMQRVVKLLGFDVGFLFQKENQFKQGCENFLKQHPNVNQAFTKMLADVRKSWQNILSTIRNYYLEHKILDIKKVERFFTIENAELLFCNCWQAIEMILVILLRTGMPLDKGIDIAEIPEKERDPDCPKRFRFVMTK